MEQYAKEILEKLTKEQLIKGFISNEINFTTLRYKAICNMYEQILKSTKKPLGDIRMDIMEHFQVSERTVINALNSKIARRLQ